MGVFGFAHLRFAQNFAHPNTPINSPHTTSLVIATVHFFWGVVGCGLRAKF